MDKMGYNTPEENIREEDIVNVYDALTQVAKASGIGTTKMSELAGRNKNFVSNSKNKGAIPRVDTYARLLKGCGWSLVAIPDDRVPDGAIVIDAPPITEEDKRLVNERKKAALLRQLDKLEAEGELLG